MIQPENTPAPLALPPHVIAELEAASGGTLSFAFHDLQTGALVAHEPDRKVKAASTIKLPILVHTAFAAHEGSCSWAEPLTVTAENQCAGSGVLKELTPGIQLSLCDACRLMIVLSDNTATNMVLDHVGIEPVNRRMRELGLAHTTLLRKVCEPAPPSDAPFGLGVTTAREMATLLTRIANGPPGPEAVSNPIVDMLATQQDHNAIPRALPADWSYFGKSGALDDARNDVGIVLAPDGRMFVLALFCQGQQVRWSVDDPGLVALGRMAGILLREHWS